MSSPDWRQAWPEYPTEPAPLAQDATDEARTEHAAALATYERSMRVWFVARSIAGGTYFPELDPPTVKPSYRELNQSDVALTLADGYAPAAPEGIRNEAATRCAAWLRDVDPAAASVSHGGEDGTDAVTYRPPSSGALRASGGTGLLSRYRVRRAGAVA